MGVTVQNGSFDGPNGLITKVQQFLSTKGWATNQFTDDTRRYGGGTPAVVGKRLHMAKDGMCWNFRSSYWDVVSGAYTTITNVLGKSNSQLHGLAANVSTGYSGSENWDLQPGGPRYSATQSVSGCLVCDNTLLNYYFFYTELPQVFFGITVECQPEVWGHLWLGKVKQYGLWRGGDFYAGSHSSYFPNSYEVTSAPSVPRTMSCIMSGPERSVCGAAGLLELDTASLNGWSLMNGSNYGPTASLRIAGYKISATYNQDDAGSSMTGAGSCYDAQPLTFIPNSFSGVLPLVPIRFARGITTDNSYSGGIVYRGELSSVYYTRIEGVATGDIREYSGRQFQIFPACGRDATYRHYGIAYEVTP